MEPHFFDVHDYGAIGDGIHDDGPAIRAATEAAEQAQRDDPSIIAIVRFRATRIDLPDL